MGNTLTEKIFAHSIGRPVIPGELVIVQPDVVMSHDSLTPSIIDILRNELGKESIHDPQQLVFVFDHVVPAATVGVADQQNRVRQFAQEQGIRLFDVGSGVCHQLLVEKKISQPGKIVIGADSHSTSYGAVGAFGTGMGSTDVAMIWATGKTWMKVPETFRVLINGRYPLGVEAKDVALKLGREISISGATYMAIEYQGTGWMTLADRQTLCSMAVELGAKAGIVPPEGCEEWGYYVPEWMKVDADARYAREVVLDLENLVPQVALPHAVDQVVDVSDIAGLKVNQVFLGTCTNGRYEDMRTAARILERKKVSSSVRLVITPASREEMLKALADGTIETLVKAGGILTTPGCGVCMGRHMGALGEGDVCLSTANRNFKGRMGAPSSKIYLGSAATAAATALTGIITDPRQIIAALS